MAIFLHSYFVESIEVLQSVTGFSNGTSASRLLRDELSLFELKLRKVKTLKKYKVSVKKCIADDANCESFVIDIFNVAPNNEQRNFSGLTILIVINLDSS